MPFPNPLLRTFVEKVTEKSFDKGLFWGIFAGTMVTHFYKEDHYKKLQRKYYTLHRDYLNLKITNLKPNEPFTEKTHERVEVHPDAKV